MGLKYKKDYDLILEEITMALLDTDNFYEFMEISSEDWSGVSKTEKYEIAKTLSDDIFYALGNEKSVSVGELLLKVNEFNTSIIAENKKFKRVIEL